MGIVLQVLRFPCEAECELGLDEIVDDLILAQGKLSNGGTAEVIPLTLGRARLCLVEDVRIGGCYENEW